MRAGQCVMLVLITLIRDGEAQHRQERHKPGLSLTNIFTNYFTKYQQNINKHKSPSARLMNPRHSPSVNQKSALHKKMLHQPVRIKLPSKLLKEAAQIKLTNFETRNGKKPLLSPPNLEQKQKMQLLESKRNLLKFQNRLKSYQQVSNDFTQKVPETVTKKNEKYAMLQKYTINQKNSHNPSTMKKGIVMNLPRQGDTRSDVSQYSQYWMLNQTKNAATNTGWENANSGIADSESRPPAQPAHQTTRTSQKLVQKQPEIESQKPDFFTNEVSFLQMPAKNVKEGRTPSTFDFTLQSYYLCILYSINISFHFRFQQFAAVCHHLKDFPIHSTIK